MGQQGNRGARRVRSGRRGPVRAARRRRSAAVLLVTALVGGTTVLLAGQPGRADDSTDCATPTVVVTGDSVPSLTLAAGQVALIAAGTYTGGIDRLAPDSVLCVALGATLRPAYVNDAGGRVVNEGTTRLPRTGRPGGASIDNDGALDLPAGIDDHGPVALRNRSGATVTVGTGITLGVGAMIDNEGSIAVAGPVTLATGSRWDNAGELRVTGPVTVDGTVSNTGVLTATGAITVTRAAVLDNRCRLAGASLANAATATVNRGVVVAGSALVNTGTWRQDPTGISTGTLWRSPGTVAGFGRYRFGTATTTGTVAAGSGTTPIVGLGAGADPAGVSGGDDLGADRAGVSGVDRAGVADLGAYDPADRPLTAPVTAPPEAYRPPGCAVLPPLSTDLAASVTGPATVGPGGVVSYQLEVANSGALDAAGVALRLRLPAGLTAVASDPRATPVGTTLTWTVGSLAAGAERTVTVTGTAPATGRLVATVSAVTTTPDADPGDNDGSRPAARLVTVVRASGPPAGPPPDGWPPRGRPLDRPPTGTPLPGPPPSGTVPAGDGSGDTPPVVPDGRVDTDTDAPVTAALAVDDPDAGQRVTVRLTTPPTHGTVVVAPGATFTYTPDPGRVGPDRFTVTGCDNGTPVRCAPATVTVAVHPVGLPDARVTVRDAAVLIPVLGNDSGLTGAVTTVTAAAHGSAVGQPDGTVRYTPDPGFTGTDRFSYRGCPPDDPGRCVTAPVTVTVLAPATPPVVGDVRALTTVDTSVAGTVAVAGPVTLAVGAAPNHGTVTLVAGGNYTYTPASGYVGPDGFTVVACDPGTGLCGTGVATLVVSIGGLRAPAAVGPRSSPSGWALVWLPLVGLLVAAGVFRVTYRGRRQGATDLPAAAPWLTYLDRRPG